MGLDAPQAGPTKLTTELEAGLYDGEAINAHGTREEVLSISFFVDGCGRLVKRARLMSGRLTSALSLARRSASTKLWK